MKTITSLPFSAFLWLSVLLLSCSTQKEVTADTSLSMERQDSTIVTTSHKSVAEQFQNLKIEVLDSLDVVMTVTEFYPQTDSVTGLQMVKSFKDIRLNRNRKTDVNDDTMTTEVSGDTVTVKASSNKAADYKSNVVKKKQTKAGQDWENIILCIVVICVIVLVIYLIWTAPPYKYDPTDPNQGWLE